MITEFVYQIPKLVKFVEKNGSPDEKIITAIDRGILELKSAISNLRCLVEAIQEKLHE